MLSKQGIATSATLLFSAIVFSSIALAQFPPTGGPSAPSLPYSPGIGRLPTRTYPQTNRPGEFGQTPTVPTVPRPGFPNNNPGFPGTNSRNNPSPGYGNQRNNRMPFNQPQQFNNPLYRSQAHTHRSPSEIQFGTSPNSRVYGAPMTGATQQWQSVGSLIDSGNYDALRSYVDNQLQQNNSLDQRMAAVWTLERGNLPASQLHRYRHDAFTLAQSQIHSGSQAPLPYVAVAKYSLEQQDDVTFRSATNSLSQLHPDHQYSHFFQGIAALKDGDWRTAERELLAAKESGMPDESVAQWLKIAIDNQKWIWQYAWITFWFLVAWLGGLLLLYLVGRCLSAITLQSINRCDPSELPHAQTKLRWVYRAVINIAGVYYYLSLPVVIFVSIALPLAIGYALLNIPVISLWLVAAILLLSIGSVITAIDGIRTCFIPVDGSINGYAVLPTEHPVLWKVVREVAAKVGTRSVDEIWMVPTSDIGVFERGSFWKRWNDTGQRVLILGHGLLDGFSERAFRSVLAHEYGHFLNRDTAGGNVAMRVNLSMMNFADAIGRRGKIRWWHFSCHFLRFYYKLFNRLTFGASRLQEVLADRVAVNCEGPSALKEGLQHAIRRSIEFDFWVGESVRKILSSREPTTMFVQQKNLPDVAIGLESVYRSLIDVPTSHEDTHPSPRDRFSYADRVGAEDAKRNSRMVWELVSSDRKTLAAMNKFLSNTLNEEAKLRSIISEMQAQELNEYLKLRRDPDVFFARAELNLENGFFDDAIEDLKQASRLGADKTVVGISRAAIHQADGKPELSIKVLESLCKDGVSDREPAIRYLLAECYQECGNLNAAANSLVKITEIEADNISARLLLGQMRLEMDRNSDAIKQLSRVIDSQPNNSAALVTRAKAYRKEGDADSATSDLKKAIEINHGHAPARRELASLLMESAQQHTRRLHAAFENSRTACGSNFELAESIDVHLRACESIGKFDGAISSIDRLLPQLDKEKRKQWKAKREQVLLSIETAEKNPRPEFEHDNEIFPLEPIQLPKTTSTSTPDFDSSQITKPAATSTTRVRKSFGKTVLERTMLASFAVISFAGVWLLLSYGSSNERDQIEEPQSSLSPALREKQPVSAPNSSKADSKQTNTSVPKHIVRSFPVPELDPRVKNAIPIPITTNHVVFTKSYFHLTPKDRPLAFKANEHVLSDGRTSSVLEFSGSFPLDHIWLDEGNSLALLFEKEIQKIDLKTKKIEGFLGSRDFFAFTRTSEGIVAGRKLRVNKTTIDLVDDSTLEGKIQFTIPQPEIDSIAGDSNSPLLYVFCKSGRIQIFDLSVPTLLYDFKLTDLCEQAESLPAHNQIISAKPVLCSEGTILLLVQYKDPNTSWGWLRFLTDETGALYFDKKSYEVGAEFNSVEQLSSAVGRIASAEASIRNELTRLFETTETEDFLAKQMKSMSPAWFSRSPKELVFKDRLGTQTVADSSTMRRSLGGNLVPNPDNPNEWISIHPLSSRFPKSWQLINLDAVAGKHANRKVSEMRFEHRPKQLKKLQSESESAEPADQPKFERVEDLVLFDREAEPGKLAAGLHQQSNTVVVKNDATLYQLSLPDLKPIATIRVPPDSKLLLTKSSIAICKGTNLALYDYGTLKLNREFELPSPWLHVAASPETSQLVFIFNESAGSKIADPRQNEFGIVDVESGKLLLSVSLAAAEDMLVPVRRKIKNSNVLKPDTALRMYGDSESLAVTRDGDFAVWVDSRVVGKNRRMTGHFVSLTDRYFGKRLSMDLGEASTVQVLPNSEHDEFCILTDQKKWVINAGDQELVANRQYQDDERIPKVIAFGKESDRFIVVDARVPDKFHVMENGVSKRTIPLKRKDTELNTNIGFLFDEGTKLFVAGPQGMAVVNLGED